MQIETFEAIAINQTPPYRPRTIKALLNAGLIEQRGSMMIRDRFGSMKVPYFEVPVPIHMQWCQWCDENISDEELDKAAAGPSEV